MIRKCYSIVESFLKVQPLVDFNKMSVHIGSHSVPLSRTIDEERRRNEEGSTPIVKFNLPDSSFWTGVIALIAVASAVTYFVFGFMSEADELQKTGFELEKDQIELRQLVTQSTEQITAKVNENTTQIIQNTEAINQLNTVVLSIRENVKLLVCDRFPEQSECQQ